MTARNRIGVRRVQLLRTTVEQGRLNSVNQSAMCLRNWFAAWHKAIDRIIPLGYEDESGFHCGETPHQKFGS
jgi:hypothetical protein